MGVFRQLGDPLAAAECLCQHHTQAYAEWTTTLNQIQRLVAAEEFVDGDVIVSVPITITERCCIAVNAALASDMVSDPANWEIERPLGTIRTTQEDVVPLWAVYLFHHAAWEVLDPGTYTYYLVQRVAGPLRVCGAWLKVIASDCEG